MQMKFFQGNSLPIPIRFLQMNLQQGESAIKMVKFSILIVNENSKKTLYIRFFKNYKK